MTLLQKLTNTTIGRRVAHALLAFAATLVPLITAAKSMSDIKAVIIACIPTAVQVLYSSLFVNPVNPVVVEPAPAPAPAPTPAPVSLAPTPTPVLPLPPVVATDAPTSAPIAP